MPYFLNALFRSNVIQDTTILANKMRENCCLMVHFTALYVLHTGALDVCKCWWLVSSHYNAFIKCNPNVVWSLQCNKYSVLYRSYSARPPPFSVHPNARRKNNSMVEYDRLLCIHSTTTHRWGKPRYVWFISCDNFEWEVREGYAPSVYGPSAFPKQRGLPLPRLSSIWSVSMFKQKPKDNTDN